MYKLAYIVVLASSLFVACSAKKNHIQYKAILSSFENSNTMIRDNNQIIYRKLDEKLADPQTRSKASIWQPKANEVRDASKKMIVYVEQLMDEIKRQASIDRNNDDSSIDETNTSVPRQLFEKQGKSQELENKLSEFKKSIIGVLKPEEFEDNPTFKNELIKTLITFKKEILGDMLAIEGDDSVETEAITCSAYFSNTDVIETLTMLTKIKNDLLLSERMLIEYFNQLTTVSIHGFTQFVPLIAQSSSVIRKEDSVEISAGIGAMSLAAQPTVTISGKKVDVGEYGLATCKIKSPNVPGDYWILVKIEYWKPDGTLSTYEKRISYRVVK